MTPAASAATPSGAMDAVAPLGLHDFMKGFTMTTITPEAVEEPRSRAGRFYGGAAFALAAAVFLTVAGGAVTPLTSLWAAEGAPPVTAPVDPGTPIEPGVTEPEPSTPVATDVCVTGTAPLTVRVCAVAAANGWTVATEAPEVVAGETFLATVAGESGPVPAMAVGDRFEVISLEERSMLALTHAHDGIASATIEPLPPQSDASLATDIREALGVSEIWFHDGSTIVDGPSLATGTGWSIMTAHDPARTVGQVVTVGWVTLTVEASSPESGTVYTVS